MTAVAEACTKAGNDCIICSKYVDRSLKTSLQGGKKRLKCGEREILYNVYKFMKAESKVRVTIYLSREQKKVAEETRVSRIPCRVLKEGENDSYWDPNARRVTATC